MPAEASVRVTTLFAPYDATTDAYLAFVASATRAITIIIYGMHLPLLTQLLIAKHQAGVAVNIILDHSQAEGRAESQEVAKLVAAGVPLLIGTSPVHGQILHTKATIIDGCAVESGSWNYSLSASFQSNTLTFVHDAEYAAAYLEHWSHIRAFILLHDMVYQPKGETPAADVGAADTATPDAAASLSSLSPLPPDGATSAPALAGERSSPLASTPVTPTHAGTVAAPTAPVSRRRVQRPTRAGVASSAPSAIPAAVALSAAAAAIIPAAQSGRKRARP